jgi:hypothetical protein
MPSKAGDNSRDISRTTVKTPPIAFDSVPRYVHPLGYEIIQAMPLPDYPLGDGLDQREARAEALNREPAPYVVRVETPGIRRKQRVAFPMKERLLHRRFLKETATEAGILAFAAEFGGLSETCAVVGPEDYWKLLAAAEAGREPPKVPIRMWCDPLADWHSLRNHIAEALALWRPSPRRLRRYEADYRQMQDEFYKAQGRLRKMDLRDYLDGLLQFHANSIMPGVSETHVYFSPSSRRLSIGTANLRADLWAHLVSEICGSERPSRVCERCGRLTPGRSDKRFCSDACRKAHARARDRQP